MTHELAARAATILGIWLVTVLSPGPNFLATAHTASTGSRRLGLAVVGGITLGTAVWTCAGLLGLGLLFQTAGGLYHALKLAGGGYLIYLGVKTLLGAGKIPPGSVPTGRPPLTPVRAFFRGLAVDLSNPKAAVFFTSLFAVTVPPDAPLWYKIFLAAAVVAMAGGWYSTVACLIHLGPVARALGRARKWIAYLSGTIFVTLGLGLAAEK